MAARQAAVCTTAHVPNAFYRNSSASSLPGVYPGTYSSADNVPSATIAVALPCRFTLLLLTPTHPSSLVPWAARLVLDPTKLAPAVNQYRIVAFDQPPGAADAREMLVILPRSWEARPRMVPEDPGGG